MTTLQEVGKTPGLTFPTASAAWTCCTNSASHASSPASNATGSSPMVNISTRPRFIYPHDFLMHLEPPSPLWTLLLAAGADETRPRIRSLVRQQHPLVH